MTTRRRFAVCVDDFGLNEAVNAGAWSLVEAGRVSALSCLTRAPAWRSGAALLRATVSERADVGLHLNLSESFGRGQWHRPLAALCAGACLHLLPAAPVRAELRAQFDAFEDAMGQAPDFVDGHQHVHPLPVVRDLLFDELMRRYPTRRPWLRNTRPPRAFRPAPPKQRVITALGADSLALLARELRYPQNRSLLGVYRFTGTAADHARRLVSWCRAMEDDGLLMTHVATAPTSGDPIARARVTEFEVLRSPVFTDALASGLAVARMSDLLPGTP